jgi:hypothetical protein
VNLGLLLDASRRSHPRTGCMRSMFPPMSSRHSIVLTLVFFCSLVLSSGAVSLPRFYSAEPAEPAEQQYASRARPYASENLRNAQGLPAALEAHGFERRPVRPPMTQSLGTAVSKVRQRQQRVRQQQHVKEGAWEWDLAVPCEQPCLPALLPFPWPVHS